MRCAIVHPGLRSCGLEGRREARNRLMAWPALGALVLANLMAGVLALAVCRAAVAAAPAAATGHTSQRAPGYLGIEFHDLSSEQAATMHLRDSRGVEVLLVDHDGPAGKAGLRPHDLITGLNGHIVASGETLRRMIREAGAGAEVKLSIFRNGVPVLIRTKLANREQVARQAWERMNAADPPSQGTFVEGFTETYAAPSQPVPVHNQTFLSSMLHSGPFTGLMVEALQPQLGNYFGAPSGIGLLVQAVDLGSPAASAGLRAGDVIVRANGHTLHSTSDWSRQLRAVKGKSMGLTVLRDRHELSVMLQPDPKRR